MDPPSPDGTLRIAADFRQRARDMIATLEIRPQARALQALPGSEYFDFFLANRTNAIVS
jgi:hypothetical protein